MTMDTTTAIARLEAALDQQLLLSGDDAVAAAGEAILAALRPAVSALALELCQQAAAEVSAQLLDQTVEVVLRDGDPHLAVRRAESEAPTVEHDSLEARLTLRLPEQLKRIVEEEASASGDSINSWVIDALSSRTRPKRRHSSSASGEFHT